MSSPTRGGCDHPEAHAAGEDFLPVVVTDEELASLASLEKTREELEAIRSEINVFGEDPAEVAVRVLKEHQILGLGEMHLSRDGHRKLGARLMPALREAGATHLALEVSRWVQPALDEFERSGQLDRGELPCLLADDEFLDILESARHAGIKLVAADNRPEQRRDAAGHTIAAEPALVDQPRELVWDEHMAFAIGQILDSDPAAKVVFWVGNMHLLDHRGQGRLITAARLLRQRFKLCTVMGADRAYTSCSLVRLTKNLRRAVAVSTSKAEQIKQFCRGTPAGPVCEPFGCWDYVFIYPPVRRH